LLGSGLLGWGMADSAMVDDDTKTCYSKNNEDEMDSSSAIIKTDIILKRHQLPINN
jgi:hypothetical protein